MRKLVSVLIALVMMSYPALASDWAVYGKVATVSTGNFPGPFGFISDVAAGNCAAGSWLTYIPQGADTTSQQENAKAAFAILLAAQLSGHHVEILGWNTLNGVSCAVVGVWGGNQ